MERFIEAKEKAKGGRLREAEEEAEEKAQEKANGGAV